MIQIEKELTQKHPDKKWSHKVEIKTVPEEVEVTWCLGIQATAKRGPGAQVTLARYHELILMMIMMIMMIMMVMIIMTTSMSMMKYDYYDDHDGIEAR